MGAGAIPSLRPVGRSQASPQARPQIPQGSEESIRFLIWDNDRNAAQTMQRMLFSIGYTETHIALGLDDGMRRLRRQVYDFLIIDQSLTNEGGESIVKALRSARTYRQTPVLVSARLNTLEVTLGAMDAGANDILTWPITLKILRDKVALHKRFAQAGGL
jgi:DNA-binding response OmpR family regulator